MSSGSFTPEQDHLGSFVKPSFGDKAKLLGFDDKANTLYEKGNSLVQAWRTVNPEASFTWRSANLFTGVDANLSKYIEPVRDIVKTVTDVLILVKEVLQAVNAVANLAANIYKLIVNTIIDLLAEIVKILNPSGAVHLLVIPPKIGNLGIKVNTVINKDDTILSRWAKNSEKTRLDFVEYFNSTSGMLPRFLQDDVAKLSGKLTNSVTGHEYLLDTIRAKLLDQTDLSRPMLCPVSHSAGVGIFIGSNALNKVLSSWNRLNSIFSSGIKFPKPVATLPTNPVIVKHNLTELNPLEASAQDATKCAASPSLESMLVTPIRPTNVIRGGLEWSFKRRHILVYKERSEVFNDVAAKIAFSREVNTILAADPIRLYEIGILDRVSTYSEKLELFSTMHITLSTEFGLSDKWDTGRAYHSPLGFPRWTKVKEGKFDPGNWLMMAVDYYCINPKSVDTLSEIPTALEDMYIGLTSEIVPFKIRDDEAEVDSSVLQFRYTTRKEEELLTPTAASPKWIAAGSSAVLLPDVVSSLLKWLEMIRQFLHSLVDDALDWLTNLISLLDRTLQYLLRIVALIDGILQLLQDLANLNTTLGASVMTFVGQGDSNALIKEFEEYLDPNVARATSESEVTPRVKRSSYSSAVVTDPSNYEARLNKFNEDITLLGRTSADPTLDEPGSTLSMQEKKTLVEKEALKNLRQGKDPRFPSVAAVARTDYNLSPVFTRDMTTCGLILMAHSPSYGRVQLLENLFKFLFDSEEDVPEETEEGTINKANLITDVPNLFPAPITTSLTDNPKALFSEDMKLVDDPSQSPFNFCP